MSEDRKITFAQRMNQNIYLNNLIGTIVVSIDSSQLLNKSITTKLMMLAKRSHRDIPMEKKSIKLAFFPKEQKEKLKHITRLHVSKTTTVV